MSKKKVLVTGARGQLGNKISELLSMKYELILTDVDSLDITDKHSTEKFITEKKPEIVIHGAAYTKVDLAEDEEMLCFKINAEGTKNIAQAANKVGATLFYISTDYVFDGQKKAPYLETDRVNPLSVYGKTKLEGEKYIEKFCKKYYIIRVSWLFGELPENHPGTNFVETMLKLAKDRDELNIINDQIGSPTYTGDLVKTIAKIVDAGGQPLPYGLYHFSGKNPCSWYDFSAEIFKQANTAIKLNPIPSSQYPQKAKRPAYSYLDKEKIEKAVQSPVRDWKEMLHDYLNSRARNG